MLLDHHSFGAVPVTVVYGADSWVTQLPLETFLHQGLTRVQVHVVDNAGKAILYNSLPVPRPVHLSIPYSYGTVQLVSVLLGVGNNYLPVPYST